MWHHLTLITSIPSVGTHGTWPGVYRPEYLVRGPREGPADRGWQQRLNDVFLRGRSVVKTFKYRGSLDGHGGVLASRT
jgi:hypothetical protein